jgi:hypothetical protein
MLKKFKDFYKQHEIILVYALAGSCFVLQILHILGDLVPRSIFLALAIPTFTLMFKMIIERLSDSGNRSKITVSENSYEDIYGLKNGNIKTIDMYVDSGIHSFHLIQSMYEKYKKKVGKIRLLCFNENARSHLESLHNYANSVEVRVYEYGKNTNVIPMHFSLFDSDYLSYGMVEKKNKEPANKKSHNVTVYGKENKFIIEPFKFLFESLWEAAKDNVIIKS